MAEKILIVHNASDRAGSVAQVLRQQGYQVLVTEGLERAFRAFHWLPELLLFDVELIRSGAKAACDEVIRFCRQAGISVLAFSSGELDAEAIQALAPWASGVWRRWEDLEELGSHLGYLTRLRRLENELAQARQMVQDRQQHLDCYLRSAAHIQRSLTPSSPPDLPEVEFAWQFLPCEKVGGDLFNILQVDEQTLMVYLVDVSGHGISSAMVTVSVYQSLSLHTGQIIKQRLDAPPFYRLVPPGEVLEELDREYPFERFEEFFTICYLLLDLPSGRLRYSSAGHPPPVLVRRDGEVELLREGGTIIGLDRRIPFLEGERQLVPGDRLYLYTDGVSENTNAAGELFGEGRLVRKLAALRREPLATVCQRVVEGLGAFGPSTHLEDDATLVGLEFLGGEDERITPGRNG